MNMYLSNKGMSLNPHKLMDNSEQRADFKRLPKNVDFFSLVNFDQLYIFLVENFFSQPIPHKKQNNQKYNPMHTRAHSSNCLSGEPFSDFPPETDFIVGLLWCSLQTCNFKSTVIK